MTQVDSEAATPAMAASEAVNPVVVAALEYSAVSLGGGTSRVENGGIKFTLGLFMLFS